MKNLYFIEKSLGKHRDKLNVVGKINAWDYNSSKMLTVYQLEEKRSERGG